MKEVIYTKNPKIGAGKVIFIAALLALVMTGPAASKDNKVLDINERFPLQLQLIPSNTNSDAYTVASNVINLAGEVHFRSLIMEDEAGDQHLTGHINMHFSGEDATGLQYIVNEESNFNQKLPADVPYTEISISKLIIQGPTDNCYLKSKFHISPNGEVKSEFESYCQE